MFVIDNPLSHPLLKNLLPSLKSFIHDTSEKVILAFVDLLLKVRGLKTIKVSHGSTPKCLASFLNSDYISPVWEEYHSKES